MSCANGPVCSSREGKVRNNSPRTPLILPPGFAGSAGQGEREDYARGKGRGGVRAEGPLFNALGPRATSGARPTGISRRDSLPPLSAMPVVQVSQLVQRVLRKWDVVDAGRLGGGGEKSKGSRTTPVRSVVRIGAFQAWRSGVAVCWGGGQTLHLFDTGSRAAERDCRRRKKGATPGEKRRLLMSAVSRMFVTCLGSCFRACRTWTEKVFQRICGEKGSRLRGKRVDGICWGKASLYLPASGSRNLALTS